MRVPALFLAASLSSLPALAQPFGSATAGVAVRGPSDQLVAAWNSGDGKAWGNAFWPDADAINVYGGVLHDNKSMGDRHAIVFSRRMKGSRMAMRIDKIRQLSPDVAIVDTIQDVDPPGAIGDAARRITVYVSLVVQRRQGTWKIVHLQNTRFSTPPPD